MRAEPKVVHNSWPRKFRWATRGIVRAIRRERNFAIHLAIALAVVITAALLGASVLEWGLLVLCITVVLMAELFNTAIEHLSRAITREHSEDLREALDTASGAVLMAAVGAAIVGSLIFLARLMTLVS